MPIRPILPILSPNVEPPPPPDSKVVIKPAIPFATIANITPINIAVIALGIVIGVI